MVVADFEGEEAELGPHRPISAQTARNALNRSRTAAGIIRLMAGE